VEEEMSGQLWTSESIIHKSWILEFRPTAAPFYRMWLLNFAIHWCSDVQYQMIIGWCLNWYYQDGPSSWRGMLGTHWTLGSVVVHLQNWKLRKKVSLLFHHSTLSIFLDIILN
jgi:hypothetical protein